MRCCAHGFKPGPLLATDFSVAQQLIECVSEVTGSETVMIDVPEPSKSGTQLIQDLMLTPVFDTARMYR